MCSCIAAVFGSFITRLYSEHAINRARNDTLSALGYNLSSVNIIRNRTLYAQHVSNSLNNTSTNATNTTIYAPMHSSEYFPEYGGIINGIPEMLPTVLRLVLLFLTLPRIFLTQSKKRFFKKHFKSVTLTPRQCFEHNNLLTSMIFRWLCVASMQPARLVSNPVNDILFKWSVLRAIVPLTFVEEAVRSKAVAASTGELSYRTGNKNLV